MSCCTGCGLPNSRGSIHMDDRPMSPTEFCNAVSLYIRLNPDLIIATDNLFSDLILSQQGGTPTVDAFLIKTSK